LDKVEEFKLTSQDAGLVKQYIQGSKKIVKVTPSYKKAGIEGAKEYAKRLHQEK